MVILTKNMGISRVFEISDVRIPDNYEIKMLMNNDMKYVPSSSLNELNGEKSLRVKIDGLQNLSDRYARIIPNMEDVQKLLYDLKNCLKEISEYLLDPGSLVLSIRYILYDGSIDRYRFLYIPGERRGFKEQLKSLLEEIMRVYDHQDRGGVIYLYDMYSKVLGDNFTPDLFLKMIGEKQEVLPKEEDDISEEISKAYENMEVVSSVLESKTDDISRRKLYILASLAVFVVSGVLYSFFGLKSLVFSSCMVVILLLYIIIDYLHTKEKKEEKEAFDYLEKEEKTILDTSYQEFKKPLIREEYLDTTVLPSKDSMIVSRLVPRNNSTSSEIYLIEGETRVGRQKGLCDYYLDDSSISRVHVIFEKHGDKVTIRDAGSTNGTYINDRKIIGEEEVEANIGDIVSIADIQYECV